MVQDPADSRIAGRTMLKAPKGETTHRDSAQFVVETSITICLITDYQTSRKNNDKNKKYLGYLLAQWS